MDGWYGYGWGFITGGFLEESVVVRGAGVPGLAPSYYQVAWAFGDELVGDPFAEPNGSLTITSEGNGVVLYAMADRRGGPSPNAYRTAWIFPDGRAINRAGTALISLLGDPEDGWTFGGWSGSDLEGPLESPKWGLLLGGTDDGDIALHARFVPIAPVPLEVTHTDGGTVDVPLCRPEGRGQGERITRVARPEEG